MADDAFGRSGENTISSFTNRRTYRLDVFREREASANQPCVGSATVRHPLNAAIQEVISHNTHHGGLDLRKFRKVTFAVLKTAPLGPTICRPGHGWLCSRSSYIALLCLLHQPKKTPPAKCRFRPASVEKNNALADNRFSLVLCRLVMGAIKLCPALYGCVSAGMRR